MKEYRGVMIGAGYFGAFQAEAWRRIAGVKIMAVADPLPGRAAEFARKFGIARAYESAAEMLGAEQPDFVDIATRPDTHLELTRLAAKYHAQVICQKPMSPTMADNLAMCEACETANVRLVIHENWRWQPWYREAKRIINSGVLGELQSLDFNWRTGDGVGREPYVAQPYFRAMPRLLIHESLVHILDTFRFLAGELRVTACETRRLNPVIAGEDWAELRVAFAGGPAGFIHGDRHTGPHPAPVAMGELRIAGRHATLRLAPDGQLFLARHAAMEERLPFEPVTTGYKGDSVRATQQHLIDCLRTGVRAESEGRDYLLTAALVDAAYDLSPTPGTTEYPRDQP